MSAASAAGDKAIIKNPSNSKVETFGIKGLDAKKVNEIESEARSLNNLPATIYNAPYWPMVAADDDTKKAVLGYIEKLSVSDSEKREMKKSMNDIWSRFPNKITQNDYPVIQKIGDAVYNYIEKTYWEGQQSAQWGSTGHKNFAYYGIYQIYKNSNWASIANTYANYPDVNDWGIGRYSRHYYNPKNGIGSAPNACAENAKPARSSYKSGERSRTFYYFGLASHYLSDVGNPMHTSGEVDQFWNSAPHYAYENYVENNWAAGYKYGDIVSSNTQVQTVTNPATAVKNLAAFSNSYYGTLWQKLTQDPNFGSNTDVRYLTTKCVRETAKYNAGLAAYLKS
jgi:hypothetical protein